MLLEVVSPRLQRAPVVLLLSALGLTISCTENVLLGSECRLGGQTCVPTEPDADMPFRPPVIGVDPADSDVPRTAVDAGSDGTVVSERPEDVADSAVTEDFASLALYNLSFERRGGVGGDIVLSNTVSVLVPIAPVDTVFAQLPNWYACVPLAVSSLTWMNTADAGAEMAASGDYLSFVINGTTVRQALGAPLTPGTRYSFEANVATVGAGADSLRLEVQGSTSVCGAGTSIGRSAPLPQSGRWTRACVTFTVDEPYTYLLLAPSYEGAAPPVSARFYLDELRQVASCDPYPSAAP